MRIVSRKALKDFAARFPEAEGRLNAWYHEAKKARWQTPADIKARYGSASILKDSRVVFNICGNNYRLVVKVGYTRGIVFVRFIGTHEEYSQVNAEDV